MIVLRVRLKSGVPYKKMSTQFGVITHEWTIVPDNSIVRNDLEIEGRIEPITKNEPISETIIEPVIAKPKLVKKKG